MQRLFVMFPDRGPGLGLLWLRLCVAAALCGPGMPGGWLSALCLLAVAMLALGVLTPLAAVMTAVGLSTLPGPWPLALLPLALLVLGPGAYSLDARLFGRRVIGRRPPPFG
ncbi:hypothetical protein [Stenotrophomonas maltophilia]|uniref:hypothetical protein n=1 Tax=Stenotrophomonas maltophilia TaxID=40324 RepID=UPI000DA854CB|nr:hypothetical protein [Stenotrophomonas maltophilia]PZS71644.1 hypothetical protein A7X75_10145 [Stenotrophomonas maltophilia]